MKCFLFCLIACLSAGCAAQATNEQSKMSRIKVSCDLTDFRGAHFDHYFVEMHDVSVLVFIDALGNSGGVIQGQGELPSLPPADTQYLGRLCGQEYLVFKPQGSRNVLVVYRCKSAAVESVSDPGLMAAIGGNLYRNIVLPDSGEIMIPSIRNEFFYHWSRTIFPQMQFDQVLPHELDAVEGE